MPLPHKKTFLRHIVDDPVASPAVCTDPDAPMVKLGSECVRIEDGNGGGDGDDNAASEARGLMLAMQLLVGATVGAMMLL